MTSPGRRRLAGTPPRPPATAAAGRRVAPPLRSGLLLALGAGALVRLALLAVPGIWYDEATTGLLGLRALRGAFPVYFYGQAFMGALDGYLAAPLYLALGVSARTLELLPVLLALLWLGLTVRLAWEAFGAAAALLTAILLAVPPDFLLRWSHEARNHYPLTLVLGTLALLLARRVPTAGRGRGALVAAVLGGVLGLAFWTNFLSLLYWPAVALVLLRRGVRSLVPRVLAAGPAFALGSLPHWLYGVPHGTAIPPPGRPIGAATVLAHLQFFGATAWPIVAGVPAPLRGRGAGGLLAVALGALYLAAGLASMRRARRAGLPGGATGVALVALAATTVGVAVGTQYGRGLNDNDPHYLLPLYTALPPLAAAWLAERRSRVAAAALAAGLVGVHVAGALAGSLGGLAPTAAAAERAELAAQRETVAALERAGLRRLYDSDPAGRVLTFLAAERVILAQPYEEILPAHARLVDGAPDAAWWLPKPWPVLEANFRALGARFAFRRVSALGGAYTEFALDAPRVRELPPETLRVLASPAPGAAAAILDRRADTLWSTGGPQRGGEWVQVDLGTLAPVALVRWLPGTYQEVPRGVRLESSPDGAVWRTLVDLPEYLGPLYWSAGHPMTRVRSGRVELRVPPTPARYLRITQTGRASLWPWTIRELYVYAAREGADGAAGPAEDGRALARALRAAGVRRVYGDHGWTSRIALADPGIAVPPANLQLDDYGFKGSATMLLPPVRWEAGTAVLVEADDAPAVAAAAAALGLAFESRALDRLVLFVHAPAAGPGRALPAGELVATASRHANRARLAVDGDPATRWATAAPRAAGDWFRVDLARPRRIRALRLASSNPADLPPALTLEASPDGASWIPVRAALHVERDARWGGFALLGDRATALRLEFAPVAARALRVALPAGDPVFDWSIHELTVYAAE